MIEMFFSKSEKNTQAIYNIECLDFDIQIDSVMIYFANLEASLDLAFFLFFANAFSTA